MDIKRFKQKLERYLNGTANEIESGIVEAWYRSYQTGEDKAIGEADKAAIKNAICQKIAAATQPRVKIRRINYYGVAASLLLASGMALLFYKTQKQASNIETYTTRAICICWCIRRKTIISIKIIINEKKYKYILYNII